MGKIHWQRKWHDFSAVCGKSKTESLDITDKKTFLKYKEKYQCKGCLKETQNE